MSLKKLLFASLFLLTACLGFAQRIIDIDTDSMIEIPVLNSKDPIFKEYSKIIEDNYMALRARREPEMLFFKHTITEADKSLLGNRESPLIAVAARCNILQETLATVNKIENVSEDLMNKTLILPTVPGLFVKRYQANNQLEVLLRENYATMELTDDDISYNINGEEFIFLTDKRLSPTERFYFMDSLLGLPLDRSSFWISSEFGRRKNPVNGEWKDHNGIDLAADEGTPVYAIKDGNVAFCISNDPTFGNYVILSHDKSTMTSVYAHLQSFCVNQYDFVKKGDIIGYVGHTGMATGSHLHFEIRQGGVAKDPQTKLNLK